MKRFIAAALVLALFASRTSAQDAGGAQAQMVKERAKRARDVNNASQGIPNGTPPAATPPAPAAPAGPRTMDPAQQQLVDKLQTDLVSIKAGSPVTPDQQQVLTSDFFALAKGATKPSKDSLARLANHFSAALAGKNVAAHDQAQMAKAINIVMNSDRVSAAQAQTFVTAVQKSLKASGVADQDTQPVVDDLKAIVTEIQKNKPKLYQ